MKMFKDLMVLLMLVIIFGTSVKGVSLTIVNATPFQLTANVSNYGIAGSHTVIINAGAIGNVKTTAVDCLGKLKLSYTKNNVSYPIVQRDQKGLVISDRFDLSFYNRCSAQGVIVSAQFLPSTDGAGINIAGTVFNRYVFSVSLVSNMLYYQDMKAKLLKY